MREHPAGSGIDLSAYTAQLIDRLAKPEVRDTVARLCAFSSDRVDKFLLPVVRAQLAADGPIDRPALARSRVGSLRGGDG